MRRSLEQTNKSFATIDKDQVKNLNDRSETPGIELSRGLRKSSLVDVAAAAAEDEEDGGGGGTDDDDAFEVDGRGLSLVEEVT